MGLGDADRNVTRANVLLTGCPLASKRGGMEGKMSVDVFIFLSMKENRKIFAL